MPWGEHKTRPTPTSEVTKRVAVMVVMGVTSDPADSGGAPGLGVIYEDGTLGGRHPRVAV